MKYSSFMYDYSSVPAVYVNDAHTVFQQQLQLVLPRSLYTKSQTKVFLITIQWHILRSHLFYPFTEDKSFRLFCYIFCLNFIEKVLRLPCRLLDGLVVRILIDRKTNYEILNVMTVDEERATADGYCFGKTFFNFLVYTEWFWVKQVWYSKSKNVYSTPKMKFSCTFFFMKEFKVGRIMLFWIKWI